MIIVFLLPRRWPTNQFGPSFHQLLTFWTRLLPIIRPHPRQINRFYFISNKLCEKYIHLSLVAAFLSHYSAPGTFFSIDIVLCCVFFAFMTTYKFCASSSCNFLPNATARNVSFAISFPPSLSLSRLINKPHSGSCLCQRFFLPTSS